MEKKEIKVPYTRDDGYNPSVKCDDPILKKWVHKDIVKKTGLTEDDFIIDQKPVCIDEINIQKSIDAEAKTTDLKYLLAQLLRQGIANPTGEEPELNKRPGFFADITAIQAGLNGQIMPSAQQIKESLPDEFKKLSVEELANMSDEAIVSYFKKVREETGVSETVQETVKNTEKGNE